MISAEVRIRQAKIDYNCDIFIQAPIVFAKACEIFILELTLRAWIQTEDNKRRTLQRNDVAMAISKNDTFDFLIDIVPREDSKSKKPEVKCGDGVFYSHLYPRPLNIVHLCQLPIIISMPILWELLLIRWYFRFNFYFVKNFRLTNQIKLAFFTSNNR